MEKQYNQELIKKIKAIKVPEDLIKNDPGIIPLGKSVLLKKVKAGERKTETGLIIADARTTAEYVARIVAVGPECSPYLKVGLLVIYNELANLESWIKGQNYLMVHESSLFYILLDDNAAVEAAPKSREQVRVEKKIKDQEAMLKRVDNKQKNDEDKYMETIKKGTKKSPKKRLSK
jgi:co-chaperonin GroES (HSP10)